MSTTLNHNRITTEMTRDFKPLKRRINAMTAELIAQHDDRLVHAPTHKILMRVATLDEVEQLNLSLITDESRERELAMKLNPTISISFTELRDLYPYLFTHDQVSEFADRLESDNYVRDGMQVFLSPHSKGDGGLNLIVVFERAIYGGESQPEKHVSYGLDIEPMDTPPAPKRFVHPLDLV